MSNIKKQQVYELSLDLFKINFRVRNGMITNPKGAMQTCHKAAVEAIDQLFELQQDKEEKK